MKEQHITINKTARYFTAGELNEHTTQVFFVLHGFGMNAKDFLQSFEPLLNHNIYIIAPEALNRYYIGKSGDKVGATWMTKEDRQNEINDYIKYLDTLYEKFKFYTYKNLKITALGFSQGSSTVTRWVNATAHKIDTLIAYAGEVAPELLPLTEQAGLNYTKNYFLCGLQDEYITAEMLAEMKVTYREMKFTELMFDGKHTINLEILKPFFKA